MNIIKCLMVFILTTFSMNVWAYGSSSSKKACKKPVFTQFIPVHLSNVEPESEFSFKASSSTNPKSVKVNVKDQSVELVINKMNTGYLIKGRLPATLADTYARIDIKAKTTSNCKGGDGWLLNIGQ